MAQTYTFDKAEVLKTLKENRKKHRTIFLEALEGYKVEAIRVFEENIEKIRNNKLVAYVTMPIPVDQTRDYDRTIALLKGSKGDDVELTEEQFANYMLDDWSWKRQFLTSNAVYSMSASQLVDEDDD